MAQRILAGRPASPGRAAGPAWRLDPAPTGPTTIPAGRRKEEAERARAALEAAAAELDALAERLDGEEAEIVATGALMAGDPALIAAATDAVLQRGLGAGAAVREATEASAAVLAALDDEMLAARADDVRSVGRRALRHLDPAGVGEVPADAVIVAVDAGPGDVIELAHRASAFALAEGGETAHAAIVARSLGLPMVAGAGTAVLDASGDIVVDGDVGEVLLEPDGASLSAARGAVARRRRARERAERERHVPATTVDGHRLAVLANVACRAEVDVALAAGAEGAGLVRTELSFLDAPGWPSEEAHQRVLAPTLEPLAGRVATVRVLDFGGDKTPPFLHGVAERGISLLLAAPDGLEAQLRAILAVGAATQLRIMLPLVDDPGQVVAAREALDRARQDLGAAPAPALGAMIETPMAAAAAREIAAVSDFLSVGTNDLTATTLGVDRFGAAEVAPHHPAVLRNIAASVRAAAAAGMPLEVCGESASDARMLPLLVGLGVDELSVGAARVGTARAWVRELRRDEARAVAHAALRCRDAASVARLLSPVARRLELLERGDDGGELVDGGRGVVSVGPQP